MKALGAKGLSICTKIMKIYLGIDGGLVLYLFLELPPLELVRNNFQQVDIIVYL